MAAQPPLSARLLRLGLLAVLLAAAFAPLAQASEPAPPPRVWTVYTRVEADVVDDYATVRVIAEIGNRGPDPEFPFVVTVPDTAMVTGLTLLRDGVLTEATIEERGAARAAYDEHKEAQMTGALVEKERGAQRFQFLVNVGEFQSVVATLTYEQLLVADQGIHALPLEAPVSGFGEDLGAAFRVSVSHRDGVADAWGEPAADVSEQGGLWVLQYAVGPRPDLEATPFSAFYVTGATPGAGSVWALTEGGQGYFVHRFQATPDEARIPIDLVLVLDTSGSMAGEPMRQMQDAAVQVLQALDEADRLHLTFFSSGVQEPWPGLRSANTLTRTQAIDEVRGAVAAGSTAIEAGLRAGLSAFHGPLPDVPLELPEAGPRLPLAVFLTDGKPTVGASDPDELRAIAEEENLQDARLFGLAFGANADWGLVAGLARDQGGLALHVPAGDGAEVDLRRFMAALTTPVLEDVEVGYAAGVDAFTTTVPVLFAGSELLWVGRFDGLAEISGTVTGEAADGPRSYAFDEPVLEAQGGEVLPRLVAYAEIRRLEVLIAAEGERQDWVDEIVGLALEHGFVTDYTSLVVTLDDPVPLEWEECDCLDVAADSAPGSPVATRTGTQAPWSTSAGGGSVAFAPTVDEDQDDGAGEESPGAGALAGLAALAVAASLRRRPKPGA